MSETFNPAFELPVRLSSRSPPRRIRRLAVKQPREPAEPMSSFRIRRARYKPITRLRCSPDVKCLARLPDGRKAPWRMLIFIQRSRAGAGRPPALRFAAARLTLLPAP